jgi:hypothetical protein
METLNRLSKSPKRLHETVDRLERTRRKGAGLVDERLDALVGPAIELSAEFRILE